MNKAIKALLTTLLNHKIMGGRHAPEKQMVVSKTKWLSKEERKEFEKEYEQLKNEQIIITSMKRTGKGYDWHISLNPKRVSDVYEMISEEQA